jgi:hypothetical protein
LGLKAKILSTIFFLIRNRSAIWIFKNHWGHISHAYPAIPFGLIANGGRITFLLYLFDDKLDSMNHHYNGNEIRLM